MGFCSFVCFCYFGFKAPFRTDRDGLEARVAGECGFAQMAVEEREDPLEHNRKIRGRHHAGELPVQTQRRVNHRRAAGRYSPASPRHIL